MLDSEEERDEEEDFSSIPTKEDDSTLSNVQLGSHSLSSDNRFPSETAISDAQAQEPLIASIRKYLTKENGWHKLDANIRLEASRCIIMDDILYVWILEQ